MIVVDTNIIAYFFIKGSSTRLAQNLLRKENRWVAPVLWKSEFRNVLALYMRQNHLSLRDALMLMDDAEQLMHKGEFEVNSEKVIGLAEQSGCSAYDCEFVALAYDLRIDLVTTDKRILNSFPGLAVPLHKMAQP